MSYVRDNGLARARRRREQRSLAILVFCALLVVGSIIFAVTFMSKSGSSSACPNGMQTAAAPPEGRFTLNIYNAGGAKGTAGDLAKALKSHNFSIGVVGNDPLHKTLANAGEIRFGPEGADAAKRYLAPLLPGAQLVNDGRDGTTVDVASSSNMPSVSTLPSQSSSSVPCR